MRYIILSHEGSSIEINGTTYTDAELIQEDFVAEKISEEQLKQAVIPKIDALLAPVRKHFAENAHAKKVLELVQGYKREAVSTENKPTISLKMFEDSKAKKVVFAPRGPTSGYKLDVELVLKCLQGLKAAHAKAAGDNADVVLFVEDWSTFTLNKFNGDRKVQDEFYKLLLSSLKLLSPEVMEKTTIVYQSEQILRDPSNYWIATINVGRKHKLDSIRKMLESHEKFDQSSQVVANTMHISDVLAMCYGNDTELIYVDEDVSKKSQIAKLYVDSLIAYDREHKHGKLNSLTVTAIEVSDAQADKENQPEEGSKEGEKKEVKGNSLELVVGEQDNFVNTKIKKCFCEAGNVETNPCIEFMNLLNKALTRSEFLEVKRSEENGGNKVYSNVEGLRADFKSLALHPGDLKASCRENVKSTLQPLFDALKGDKDFKNACKALENFEKKMNKKK